MSNVVPTDDISKAQKRVTNKEKIYTGVIYQNKKMKDYYSNLKNRKNRKSELVNEVKNYSISSILSDLE